MTLMKNSGTISHNLHQVKNRGIRCEQGKIVAPLQLLPLFFIWSEIRDKKNDLIREVQFYKILSSFLGFNDVYLGKTINISNSFYTVYGIVK